MCVPTLCWDCDPQLDWKIGVNFNFKNYSLTRKEREKKKPSFFISINDPILVPQILHINEIKLTNVRFLVMILISRTSLNTKVQIPLQPDIMSFGEISM